MKGAETVVLPGLLLAGSSFYFVQVSAAQCRLAGPDHTPSLPGKLPLGPDLTCGALSPQRRKKHPVPAAAAAALPDLACVQALTAGGSVWLDYAKLFEESRLVHASTIDFALLTAFIPFWMSNDAELRQWGPRCGPGMCPCMSMWM